MWSRSAHNFLVLMKCSSECCNCRQSSSPSQPEATLTSGEPEKLPGKMTAEQEGAHRRQRASISPCDKHPARLRAITLASHVKTCQHASAGKFLEGQKYRSQVTRDCSAAGKWLSRLDALQLVQLRRVILFFFF